MSVYTPNIVQRKGWHRGLFAIVSMLSVFVSLCVSNVPAQAAAPPSTMNFQGRLTDNSGNIMADGLYNMQFRVYSTSSAGTALWSETRETTDRVQITNGLFSTQIGEVTPLPASLFDNTNLYFEITMATPATATCSTASCASWESPMTPRNKLATSAYAFNAASLNGYTDADFAAASGSANYIQNQSGSPQTADFNISGTGRVGGTFTADGAVAANSTALFKNATDSTTAFQVQNAASTSLLSVDTTNRHIVIGSGTTDTTAVLLVTDSFNNATDPTGANGSMYYNSNRGKLRCYEGSIWKNCDTMKGVPTARTANYTAKDGDFIIADASSGSFTVTLPAPSSGATVSVKKVNSGNSVTVTCTGGVQIDNLSSDILTTQWVSQDYFSDGTKWYRV